MPVPNCSRRAASVCANRECRCVDVNQPTPACPVHGETPRPDDVKRTNTDEALVLAKVLADHIISDYGATHLPMNHEDYTSEDEMVRLALEIREVLGGR
jgi:hypothetical protein